MSRRRHLVLFFAAAAMLLALAPVAQAKVYHPNKTGDTVPNGCTSSDCTLREAIISANASTTVSDKIILEHGKTYKLALPPAAGPDDLSGDLDIRGGGLTIESDSADRLAKVNAKGVDRVFQVGLGGTATKATFRRLMIRGGRKIGDGGAMQVLALSSVRISKSAITANRSTGFGGGIDQISSTASLNMRDSTVSGNVSGLVGGGLDAASGNLTVTNSTIADNKTNGIGGGILLSLSPQNVVKLTNVTIARNTANLDGGGAGQGGGLWRNSSGSVTVRNSIVALNSALGPGSLGPDCYSAGGAPFTSAGVNLFSNLGGCLGFASPPNIVTKNSKLGKLTDNGGPTKTIVLKKGSRAIGSAGNGATKRDQRGVPRTKPADIGAFEAR